MRHFREMTERGIESLYLAGPMSGEPNHGGPAFTKAAARLRRHTDTYKIYIHNPFRWEDVDPENPREAREAWETYMAKDLPVICESGGVVILDGWERSRGATFEGLVARMLKKPVYRYSLLWQTDHLDDAKVPPLSLVRAFLKRWSEELLERPGAQGLSSDDDRSVLEEAMDLVQESRMAEYGHPAKNFAAIARVWTGLLCNYLREDAEVEGWMVPWLMIGLKACRHLTGKRKRDNPVDVAGYLRAGELAEARWDEAEEE